MTYRQITKVLEEAGVENAAYDAAQLIAHFCKIEYSSLLLRRDEELNCPTLDEAVALRASRYPLQYIIGQWQFCNETYFVGKGCLIPRRETEELVELAIKRIPHGSCFMDLCTGSGCIAISTLAARQDLRALGVDLSDDALAYAKRNAELNGVCDRLELVRRDVLEKDAARKLAGGDKKFGAILSNPPYIPTDVVKTLEQEVKNEPECALDGGADGLSFYRAIVSGFADCLEDGGFFLFEIGYDQRQGINGIAEENGMECSVIRDLCGNDRMAYLTRLKGS